jgi:hypothetical protein
LLDAGVAGRLRYARLATLSRLKFKQLLCVMKHRCSIFRSLYRLIPSCH